MHESNWNQKSETVHRKSVILKIKFIDGRAWFFVHFLMKTYSFTTMNSCKVAFLALSQNTYEMTFFDQHQQCQTFQCL